MRKNLKNKWKILLCTLTITLFSATAVFALYNDKSFYDAISWTYTYDAPYTESYNCLGYATGSFIWEWKWGPVNPTKAEVNSYLGSAIYNYKNASYGTPIASPLIIGYGTSTNITHFSKVTSYGQCTAKWGGLERFVHGSLNPYYSTSVYGNAQMIYYK